jgi:hypothetical protein
MTSRGAKGILRLALAPQQSIIEIVDASGMLQGRALFTHRFS